MKCGLVFIDVEASSLSPNSYPIEVGWVYEDGTGESFLVRPPEEWDDWDPNAQALHGISRAMLQEQGIPVEEAARRVHELVHSDDYVCASDAPGFDAMWLNELLASGGVNRGVKLWDVHRVYQDACRPLYDDVTAAHGTTLYYRQIELARAMVRATLEGAIHTVVEEVGVRHRALADAQREWKVWREIERRVKEQAEHYERPMLRMLVG